MQRLILGAILSMSTVRQIPEIDGLRALAILSVVLFHAGLPGMTGGYIGVDVFFCDLGIFDYEAAC